MHLLETARRFTNHDVNNDICDVWQKLGKYGVYHESTIWSQLHTRRVFTCSQFFLYFTADQHMIFQFYFFIN